MEGFKAALCALNSKYVHSSLAPWYLAAAARQHCPGVLVEVLEANINQPLPQVAQKIIDLKAGVVGFSCYIWNIEQTLKLACMVKSALPGAVVVLGGPEVAYRAGEILSQCPQVDFVVSGEGERPFAELLNRLLKGLQTGGAKENLFAEFSGGENNGAMYGLPCSPAENSFKTGQFKADFAKTGAAKTSGEKAREIVCANLSDKNGPKGSQNHWGEKALKAGDLEIISANSADANSAGASSAISCKWWQGLNFSGVPGLCYRDGENTVVSTPYTPADLPPNPYTSEYFKSLNRRISYIEGSRGCPFLCAFCLSGRCGGVRYFDIDALKQNMLALAAAGSKTIKFVDRTFNANKKRAYEIIDFIIKNYKGAIPKGTRFHFEIAGDILDDDTIDLLNSAPAGCIQLEIGLQSFNEKTLEAINRKTDLNKLQSNIRRLVGPGNIHIHIDLIAGLPYEGFESFKDSFDKAFALKPHMLQLGFLKLLHGSPMRENPPKYPCRYDTYPPYQVRQTPWISSRELELLGIAEEALDRLFGRGRFGRTLEYILQATGIRPIDLFLRFGQHAADKGAKGMGLWGYTRLVYDYFSKVKGVDKTKLRDKIICDRVATDTLDSLGGLNVFDADLKKAKDRLAELEHTRTKPGVRRGVALLYSKPLVVFADYDNKNPVTGEYELRFVEKKELGI